MFDFRLSVKDYAAKGKQPYFHKGQKQADGFRYSFHFVYFISKQKTLICYDYILQQATGLSSEYITKNSISRFFKKT